MRSAMLMVALVFLAGPARADDAKEHRERAKTYSVVAAAAVVTSATAGMAAVRRQAKYEAPLLARTGARRLVGPDTVNAIVEKTGAGDLVTAVHVTDLASNRDLWVEKLEADILVAEAEVARLEAEAIAAPTKSVTTADGVVRLLEGNHEAEARKAKVKAEQQLAGLRAKLEEMIHGARGSRIEIPKTFEILGAAEKRALQSHLNGIRVFGGEVLEVTRKHAEADAKGVKALTGVGVGAFFLSQGAALMALFEYTVESGARASDRQDSGKADDDSEGLLNQPARSGAAGN